MAPDSRLPVRPRPAGPRLVAPPGAGRVPPPGVGTGVRCGEPFVPGNGVRPERGPPSRPSRLTHVRVEPGAKPFVDDLLLGRGFVRSRAAPSLRSIESQPSTQGIASASQTCTDFGCCFGQWFCSDFFRIVANSPLFPGCLQTWIRNFFSTGSHWCRSVCNEPGECYCSLHFREPPSAQLRPRRPQGVYRD